MIHSIGLDSLYSRQTLALTGLGLAMTGTGWCTEMVQGLGQSVIVPGSRMGGIKLHVEVRVVLPALERGQVEAEAGISGLWTPGSLGPALESEEAPRSGPT